MFKRLFCSHDMKSIFEYTSESIAEQLARIGGNIPKPVYMYDVKELTSKKQVVIVCCSKCGKMKTIKTKFN
ncbi:hypothetical protein 65p270 [Aeromonas phage 65]|uniref:Uncharacterized protein n=2 Tax=Ishigurovirus osborne TaxID=260149 RepID=A0A219YCD5_9CAUD|nr:hypothetical protein ST65p270 [Aeromonas phage 65]ADQ53278.1 hypothetical protein 65p270 [Aeromonas phage 65]APU01649.1 hypothetical protein [Aeromonas phage 65.2]